ncbi:MAG: hypothetical protein ACTS5F_01995 [Candidatus Hodgkinia cicadicola]
MNRRAEALKLGGRRLLKRNGLRNLAPPPNDEHLHEAEVKWSLWFASNERNKFAITFGGS